VKLRFFKILVNLRLAGGDRVNQSATHLMDLLEHLGLNLGPMFEASYLHCTGPEKMFIQYHKYKKHLT
jgi:hypothetical protein